MGGEESDGKDGCAERVSDHSANEGIRDVQMNE